MDRLWLSMSFQTFIYEYATIWVNFKLVHDTKKSSSQDEQKPKIHESKSLNLKRRKISVHQGKKVSVEVTKPKQEFKCTICSKSFSKKGSVSEHISLVHGKTPFKCSICNVGFSRKSSLTSHIAQDHEEKKENVDNVFARYGNTGYRVFKWGLQNWKDFCFKINIPKKYFWILRTGLMGRCQKVPKFDFQSQLSTKGQKRDAFSPRNCTSLQDPILSQELYFPKKKWRLENMQDPILSQELYFSKKKFR